MIERLISKLIDDAIVHNGTGGVLSVAIAHRDEMGVVSVTNTGPVVANDQVEWLFEPFQGLHDRTGHGVGFRARAFHRPGRCRRARRPGRRASSSRLMVEMTSPRFPAGGTTRRVARGLSPDPCRDGGLAYLASA